MDKSVHFKFTQTANLTTDMNRYFIHRVIEYILLFCNYDMTLNARVQESFFRVRGCINDPFSFIWDDIIDLY